MVVQRLLLAGLFFLLASLPAQAITVNAERQIVPLNETLRVNISASSGDLDDVDLTGIEQHFDIVGRSSQRSVSIVNGRTESIATLALTLAPKAIGGFYLPALEHGNTRSKPIRITVIKPLPVPDKLADQSVVVESEVNQASAAIGEQVLYTFRVIYAVQLSNPEITPFEAEDADVEILEDKNYQRDINGKRYNVSEKRFAVFFNKAGKTTLQPQTLSAIVSNRRQGGLGFDPFARGTQLKLASRPIELDITPRPDGANPSRWLPASELDLSESALPAEVRVGEPVSRAIRIFAKGLNAERLPEIAIAALDNANLYRESPTLTNQEWLGGLAGERIETLAIVPTAEGTLELPGIELPWWNTQTDRWETATLPRQTINVLPAPVQAGSEPPAPPPPVEFAQPAGQASAPPQSVATNDPLWRNIAIALGAAWLLTTLGLVILLPRRTATPPQPDMRPPRGDQQLKAAAAQLSSACHANDAPAARLALDAWLYAWYGSASAANRPQSTRDILLQLGEPGLTDAAAELDRALYAAERQADWRGERLAAIIASIKGRDSGAKPQRLAPLYPGKQ